MDNWLSILRFNYCFSYNSDKCLENFIIWLLCVCWRILKGEIKQRGKRFSVSWVVCVSKNVLCQSDRKLKELYIMHSLFSDWLKFFLAPLGVLTRACGLDKEGFAEHTKRSPAKGLKHGLGKARDLKKVALNHDFRKIITNCSFQ